MNAPSETDPSPIETMRRYHVALLVLDAQDRPVWAGGFLKHAGRPTKGQLLEIYRADALQAFQQRGEMDAVPTSVHVAHLFELPDPPTPPSDARPMRNWRIEINFVCHDVKFGSSSRGVFPWPEEPSGSVLDWMHYVLMAEMLSLRGDGPDYADYSEVVSATIGETSEPADY